MRARVSLGVLVSLLLLSPTTGWGQTESLNDPLGQSTTRQEVLERQKALETRRKQALDQAQKARQKALERHDTYLTNKDLLDRPKLEMPKPLTSPFTSSGEEQPPTAESLAKDLLKWAPKLLESQQNQTSDRPSGLLKGLGSVLRDGEKGLIQQQKTHHQRLIDQKNQQDRSERSGSLQPQPSTRPSEKTQTRSRLLGERSRFSTLSPKAPTKPLKPSLVKKPMKPMTVQEVEARRKNSEDTYTVTPMPEIAPLQPMR